MGDTQTLDRALVISFPTTATLRTDTQEVKTPSILREVLSGPRLWTKRLALRRELRRLHASGPHLIRDIGLEEAGALQEASLPFWKRGTIGC